jgi:hypothetical protein
VSEPTKEYLFAKAELCTKLARQQEERDEIAEALRNIERANRAMARIFNLEEECVDCGRPLAECEADEEDCGQMKEDDSE